MQNYKMIISYDGTHYGGWQIQPRSLSIQEVLQQKIAICLQEKIHVTGSGRTDAGVHAMNQTAHFFYGKKLDLFRLQYSLNTMLPPDIRIKSIEEAPYDFHARYSAKAKTYYYFLRVAPYQDPFRRLYCWHFYDRHFDWHLVKKGAAKLIGTHNFKGFANEGHRGTASYDSIRTLTTLDFDPSEEEVRFAFTGDGFLYKMVRNCMGTLVDIGRGKLPLGIIDEILSSHDRRLGGQTAPPHGLFLANVAYGP